MTKAIRRLKRNRLKTHRGERGTLYFKSGVSKLFV